MQGLVEDTDYHVGRLSWGRDRGQLLIFFLLLTASLQSIEGVATLGSQVAAAHSFGSGQAAGAAMHIVQPCLAKPVLVGCAGYCTSSCQAFVPCLTASVLDCDGKYTGTEHGQLQVYSLIKVHSMLKC